MQKKRALIVEDDGTSSRLLQHLVAPYLDCEIAKDGEAAIGLYLNQMVDGKRFDIVFLDIELPGLDGQDVLSAIRGAESGYGVPPECATKIVMTSACEDSQSLYQAHTFGCNDYLIKPLEAQTILRVLERLGVTVHNS